MSIVICIYRIGRFFHKNGMSRFGKTISFMNRFLFATWLPASADIGGNFKIGYGGLGVVIHSKSVIGKNVTVSQNVTIGRNFGDKNVPKIGDDVYVGAGSVIFGDITVGNNVIIGANTVVNKSIPDNCTVVGNPFHIIKSDREIKYYDLDNNKHNHNEN